MLYFVCPRCKSTQESPDHTAGSKVPCPKCGQRLQIPLPPPNKTILAPSVPMPTDPDASSGVPLLVSAPGLPGASVSICPYCYEASAPYLRRRPNSTGIIICSAVEACGLLSMLFGCFFGLFLWPLLVFFLLGMFLAIGGIIGLCFTDGSLWCSNCHKKLSDCGSQFGFPGMTMPEK